MTILILASFALLLIYVFFPLMRLGFRVMVELVKISVFFLIVILLLLATYVYF